MREREREERNRKEEKERQDKELKKLKKKEKKMTSQFGSTCPDLEAHVSTTHLVEATRVGESWLRTLYTV